MPWNNIGLDLGSIISLIAGMLIGGAGIYITLKYRQVGQIRILFVRSIRLVDTLVRNVSNLAVVYKNRDVSEHLTYVEGAIVNAGTLDITKTMIAEKTLVIATGAGNRLIEFKILAGGFCQVVPSKNETSIGITLDLFKKGEFIPFSALVEQNNQDSPLLIIESRIAQVTVLKALRAKPMVSTVFSNLLLSIAAVYLGVVVLSALTLDRNPYRYTDDRGDVSDVNLVPRADGTIDIVHDRFEWGSNGDSILANLNESEVFRTDKIRVSIETNVVREWLFWIVIVAIGISAVFFIIEYVRHYKLRRPYIQNSQRIFPGCSVVSI